MKDYCSSFEKKQVLVTGGAGFIGSHLVDALVGYGAQVTVLDNFSTGTLENIAHHQQSIRVVQADIRDYAACSAVLSGKEYVFHLAACVSVPQSFTDPQLCYATNVTGTFNLLQASAHAGTVHAFVFSSSSAVYGDKQIPCDEQSVLAPLSPYGYSKQQGELCCQQYSKLFSLATVSLRYFNVYGPRQNPYGPYAGVRAQFCKAMQEQRPITIYGDGLQVRDFVPVGEVVDANLNAAVRAKTLPQGCAINVATGVSISVLDTFYALNREFPNYKAEPVFEPARVGDIRCSLAHVANYRALLV